MTVNKFIKLSNKNKMRHWIEAARIRTLPLSVSGIIVGSMALANPTDYTYPYRGV
jgi:1,4-dihydroxy-2-naphthoate octaprenyltransferase